MSAKCEWTESKLLLASAKTHLNGVIFKSDGYMKMKRNVETHEENVRTLWNWETIGKKTNITVRSFRSFVQGFSHFLSMISYDKLFCHSWSLRSLQMPYAKRLHAPKDKSRKMFDSSISVALGMEASTIGGKKQMMEDIYLSLSSFRGVLRRRLLRHTILFWATLDVKPSKTR